MNYYWRLIFILFLLLRLPSIFEPYWYGDEGIYLTLGQGIRSGLTLYSQIHDNKPPTLYYLAAIAQSVFGFRLLLMAWMVPTIYLFHRLSGSRLSTLIFILLTSVPLVEGNIANAEIFMLLPTIAGIIMFNSRKYIYSGLLLGFAFTIKVPVFSELFFLFFWLLMEDIYNRRFSVFRYLALGSGFLVPILSWGIYFSAHGAFSEFVQSALLQNFGYLSSWATGSHSGSGTQGGLLVRGGLLIISLVLVAIYQRRKVVSQRLSFNIMWFLATLFGALLSTRPYPHYLIQVIPPLCLLLPKIKSNRLVVLIPALLFLVVVKYKFYFYPVISYYRNFYLGFNSLNYYGAGVKDTYKIASYVKDNSLPSDRIFIWGDEPYIYPLSDRLPATKYIVAYHIVDFRAHQSTISEIKTSLPKIILYFSNQSRPYPELDQIINRYYHLANQIGNCLVFIQN